MQGIITHVRSHSAHAFYLVVILFYLVVLVISYKKWPSLGEQFPVFWRFFVEHPNSFRLALTNEKTPRTLGKF